jgi:DNA-binding NarL/FixJ family response regulator
MCLALHGTSRGFLRSRGNLVNIRMSSHKILVVEDHEAFCGLIISIVQKADLHVVGQASDGLEAIQKAEELRPDLILLDIGLPNLNGIEVARRLRKTSPHIKILFVSQESSFEIVQETLDLGALGYVHKSQVQTDLVLAIKSVLDGRQFVSSAAKRAEPKEITNARAPRFHEILAYSDEADLLESFTRFIGTALRAGNPAMVVATEPHWGNIVQRLAKEGLPIRAALQDGTCIWLDSANTPDPVRFLSSIKDLVEVASDAARAGGRRVALCGELAGRMWTEGRIDEAFQLEQTCNDLVKLYDVDILCAYPVDTDSERTTPMFQKMCAEHSAVRSK